jgi:NAD(P)-dependent dehydrogenase (short-subunit alcohol dehydrogenase family)
MSKHCIVIGGTRGLGRAVGRHFARTGYHVSALGRRPVTAAAQEPGLIYHAFDLLDATTTGERLRALVREHGKLTALIFAQRYRGDQDTAWHAEFATSLTATRDVIDCLADHFAAEESPSIVVIGSPASSLVADNQPLSYHVAKAGLAQLVRFYAVTLGGKGIRVNGLSPCAFIKDESAPTASVYQTITPLGRMPSMRDIVPAIEFLCSSGAAMITGQNLVVDGGLSLVLQDSVALRELRAAK